MFYDHFEWWGKKLQSSLICFWDLGKENWLLIRKADLFLRNTLLSAGSRGAGNSHGFLLASREMLMELSAYHLVTLCNFVIIFALVSQWFFLTGFSLALINFTLPLLMVSNTFFFSVGKGLVWGGELYLEAGIFPLGLTRLGKQEIRRTVFFSATFCCGI